MLKGDLTTTPLAPLLLSLAADGGTGCLHISDPDAEEALVFFKQGDIYAVFVPGRRPQLGAKLVSSGALTPEALADALEAQRSELHGWKLGELLVHLGYVDQPVVEAFVKEQVKDALWDLMRWNDGRWKFRKNERTREDVAPPMSVENLMAELRERGLEWESISAVVHGPTAVPTLSSRGDADPETVLDSDAWSMLCKIDGERSLAELARDCGYTIFEAGHVLVRLVQAGLVDIEEDIAVPPSSAHPIPGGGREGAYGVVALTAAFAEDNQAVVASDEIAEPVAEAESVEPVAVESVAFEESTDEADALSRLTRLISEVSNPSHEGEVAPVEADAAEVYDPAVAVEPEQDIAEPSGDEPESYELPAADLESQPIVESPADPGSIAELSPVSLRRNHTESFADSIARVSAALSDVLGAEPISLPEPRTPATKSPVRAARLRAAADAELAAAQSLATAMNHHEQEANSASDEQAEAERLAAEQAEADRLAAEQAEAERSAAEQAEAERTAWEQAEIERIAFEQAEAERSAAQREAEQLAYEQAEAERTAWEQAEAARREAEQMEADRLTAEQAEAARIAEAERAAAEQAELDRLTAEHEESARLAREQADAERLEAEQMEADRLAAEQVEAARIAEAERAAAEQAELDRLTAEHEESARLAREQADAERLEAEQMEADRLAAEQVEAEHQAELARIAAEDAEAAELAAREEQRGTAAAVAAMLSDLSIAPVEPITAEPDEAPEEDVHDLDHHDEDRESADILQPVGVGAATDYSEMTDTAALLRELSSLGGDDPAPPQPQAPPRQPHKPTPAGADKKKKRGIFGIGG